MDGMNNDLAGDSPYAEQPTHGAPDTPSETAPATFTTPSSRSRRRMIPFALLGTMTIGTGLAAFFAVRDATTPSEAVASALTNSLRFKSAATAMSIRLKEAQSTVTITSEGVTDFDNDATTQVVQILSGAERIREHVVRNGSTIYVHLDGGAIAKIVPGKSWVSLPIGQSATTSVTGGGAGNAAALLRVLSAIGNDVSGLGGSHVHGLSVQLYAVHLTRTQINQDIARDHLPQFVRQDIALAHIPAITYTLAINGVNQLMQMKASIRLQVDGQHITEHLTEGYSRYGTKVTATTPPSSEVVPFQTFLNIAQRKDMRVTI
jgi:hypothetical protein